jgi:hypothetical protein
MNIMRLSTSLYNAVGELVLNALNPVLLSLASGALLWARMRAS